MPLASERRRIASEWHAEKIPAQHFQNRGEVRVGLFLRPGRDGERADFSAASVECDGRDVPAKFGDECLDGGGGETPRRLTEDNGFRGAMVHGAIGAENFAFTIRNVR